MNYDKLDFWETPLVQGNEVVKERTYTGFLVWVGDEPCGTLDWNNTNVHNFAIDHEFDYIEIALDSLAKALGQEFAGGVARLPARANEKLDDLYSGLYQHSYPTHHYPLPTPEAIELQAHIGQIAIGIFLDEPLNS